MIISNSVWNFKLEKFTKGQTIIKYGEVGWVFYVILQGKTDVFLPTQTTLEFKDAQTGEISKKKIDKEEKV